jgi:putative nucleotidyltransferase with HDIG domain
VMLARWGKQKLRPAVGRRNRYQSLMFPESAASDARASSRLGTRKRILPPTGTDGMSEGITLKGEFQGTSRRTLRWLFALDAPLKRRDWALISYTGWLVLLFAVLVTEALTSKGSSITGPTWPLAALAVSAFLVERQSVRLTPRAAVSVSSLPIVLAAVIYGPLAAIVVSVASLLSDFRAPFARWIIWTSSRSIAAGCAGVVALKVSGASSHGFGRVVAAVAAATLIEQLGDLALGSVAARLRGMTIREIAKFSSAIFVALPLYVPITAVLVYTYREISPCSVVLFLFPAFAAQKFFVLYQEQRATSQELAIAIEQQEKANLSFASALVATLDARDRYTAGHSAAVAVYARDIAARLGLDANQQELAHLCGLVHDIGKVGLPTGLLEKPGPLTLEERRQMEEHATIGERILKNVEGHEKIAHVVRHHHERIDGQGYPDRLVGDDIPLLARIIAVADAYDAMTSDRPYRDSMPSQVARLRMAQAVGSQFDTTVVAGFEAILAQAPDEYRVGVGTEFMFEAQTLRARRGTLEASAARPRLTALHAQAS